MPSITITHGLAREKYATLTNVEHFEGLTGDAEVHFDDRPDAQIWVDRIETAAGDMTMREAYIAGLIEAYQSTQLQP